jgi:hypothetical protein
VYLVGVYLTGVHLVGIHLIGVYLTGVHLMGAYLMGVQLIGVYLISVCLMDVYLRGVHLMGVYLIELARRIMGRWAGMQDSSSRGHTYLLTNGLCGPAACPYNATTELCLPPISPRIVPPDTSRYISNYDDTLQK